MKKFMLFAGLLLSVNLLSAQDCDPGSVINIDFESVTAPELPECTTVINSGGGNDWVTANNPGSGFDNNTLHYAGSSSGADAWFFTDGINLTAGSFYKISYKYGNNSADTNENLAVTFGTEPTIATAQSLTNHTGITNGVPNVQTIELFSAPATGTYYFGFHAISDADQGSLYIDDIVIEPVVCGTPSNVQVSDITETGATISWGAISGSNISVFSIYQYAIAETDTPPADGNYHNTTSVDLTDLEPGTTYYVFTRALCGPVWGDWTESISFTTPSCEAATVPYLLDFESATVPGFPDCTVAVPATAGNNWVTVNNPGNGFTTNALQYIGDDNAADAWLLTQGIELNAGTYYKVSYKYGNNSTETSEKLRIKMGTTPSISSLSDFSHHNPVSGGEQTLNIIEFFNVPASGVYYFGINAYSDASQGNLYVDDFLVEELECGAPSNINISDITDTSATISWETPTTGNSTTFSVYQYAFSTNETAPAEGTFEPGFSTTLNDLEPETTYYVFTRTQCGPIWSDWTITEFTTSEELGIDNSALAGPSIYPNPVKDVLNITNSATINKITIYNITGQLVYTHNGKSQNENINLSQLTGGVYLVTVTSENGTSRIKIIKE